MSAAYPQCFPQLRTGSQFGPRTFKGRSSFHYGRDQPAGVGSVRYAPAAGVVLAHGQNSTYGHYIVVLYDGARYPESMHQVQAGGRWPVGKRFAAGDPLAKVGHPHLWLPEALRTRMPDWSGGSKASSTGQHSHQQCWADRFGGTAIDPAGPQAAADWARVITRQTRPASTTTTPLEPIPLEDDDMQIINIEGHLFALSRAQIVHLKTPAQAKIAAQVFSVQDEVHKLTSEQGRLVLEAAGVPPQYVNPDNVPVDISGLRWWSRERQIGDQVARLATAVAKIPTA